MDEGSAGPEGLRARKRRETLGRIAREGLRLFAENGYDATTLETVAAASGVSPRTLFHYFGTKDDILRFWQGGGFLEALGPALLQETLDEGALGAVRRCLLRLIPLYEDERSVTVDRILNSTEALRSRKQAIFIQMEETVSSTLCELWPAAERRAALRTVAMVSIGALRLAMETKRQDNGARSLTEYLRDEFRLLEDMAG